MFAFGDAREKVDGAKAEALLHTLPDPYTHVNLSGKSFNEVAAKVVADRLRQMTNVTEVDFSDVIAGQETDEARRILAIFSASIAHYPLVSLDLSDNALGSGGVRACKAALSNKPSLRRLYFNNDGLDNQGEAAALIYEYVVGEKTTCELEVFEIHNNLICDPGAKGVSQLLAVCPNLRTLRLSTTRISNDGGELVCAALSKAAYNGLQHLILNDNNFGEKACDLLLKGFMTQRHATLKTLNLGDTGFGEDGIIQILEALCGVALNLETLNLCDCDLTAKSVPVLARVLASKLCLRSINLEGNELGSNGALVVVQALRGLPLLEEVVLGRNNIKSKAALALAQALSAHQHLKKVDLNSNAFSSHAVALLQQGFKASPSDVLAAQDWEIGSDNDEEDDDDEDDEDQASLVSLLKELSTAGP